MTALDDIAAERHRQISGEGYDDYHDDLRRLGELAIAAALYALPDQTRADDGHPLIAPDLITSLRASLRQTCGFQLNPDQDRRRRLVKAGALIVAEIDRLDRLARAAAPLS